MRKSTKAVVFGAVFCLSLNVTGCGKASSAPPGVSAPGTPVVPVVNPPPKKPKERTTTLPRGLRFCAPEGEQVSPNLVATAAKKLAAGLASANEGVRQQAFQAASGVDSEAISKALVEHLPTATEELLKRALRCSTPEMHAAMESMATKPPNPNIHLAAFEFLTQSNEQTYEQRLSWIEKGIETTHPDIQRFSAWEWTETIESEKRLAFALKHLSHENESVRVAMLSVLDHSKDPRALDTIRKIAKGDTLPDNILASAALHYRGEVSAEDYLKLLNWVLSDKNRAPFASDVLRAGLNDRAEPKLRKALVAKIKEDIFDTAPKNVDVDIFENAAPPGKKPGPPDLYGPLLIELVHRANNPEVVDLLTAAFQHSNGYLRRAALRAVEKDRHLVGKNFDALYDAFQTALPKVEKEEWKRRVVADSFLSTTWGRILSGDPSPWSIHEKVLGNPEGSVLSKMLSAYVLSYPVKLELMKVRQGIAEKAFEQKSDDVRAIATSYNLALAAPDTRRTLIGERLGHSDLLVRIVAAQAALLYFPQDATPQARRILEAAAQDEKDEPLVKLARTQAAVGLSGVCTSWSYGLIESNLASASISAELKKDFVSAITACTGKRAETILATGLAYDEPRVQFTAAATTMRNALESNGGRLLGTEPHRLLVRTGSTPLERYLRIMFRIGHVDENDVAQ